MTVASFFDHLVDWIWGGVVVVLGWAWTIDRRVAKLETLQTSTKETVDELRDELRSDIRDVSEKLDRLVDKLL